MPSRATDSNPIGLDMCRAYGGGAGDRWTPIINKDHEVHFTTILARSMQDLSFFPGTKMLAVEFCQDERFRWSVSIFAGILMCKIVYDVTGWISLTHFKVYNRLSKAVKVEWNNRGFSTFHALLVASVAFYLVLLSDVLQNDSHTELMINGKSTLSDTILGVSIGYFLSDLGMILLHFPALGGKEYVLHHCISMYSIILSLLSGQAQIYILMVLFSEITTPFVNLRWYLDVAGLKNSKYYVYNGIALFLGWLVARVLLFIFFFYHMYLHFDQVKRIFPLGFYSLFVAPPLLAVMNLFWFWKILKGLKKTLSKARHSN